MKAQVKVGRIAGISIGLHYSWFIIALLIALSLAQHFRAVAPHWSGIEMWMAAVITGLLFFAALLLHELALSLLAKARGLRVRAIPCSPSVAYRRSKQKPRTPNPNSGLRSLVRLRVS